MQRNVIKIFIIYLVIETIIPQKAYAYLDPGTGSLIVQMIIAAIAGISCTFAVWKDKILSIFKKGSKDD